MTSSMDMKWQKHFLHLNFFVCSKWWMRPEHETTIHILIQDIRLLSFKFTQTSTDWCQEPTTLCQLYIYWNQDNFYMPTPKELHYIYYQQSEIHNQIRSIHFLSTESKILPSWIGRYNEMDSYLPKLTFPIFNNPTKNLMP